MEYLKAYFLKFFITMTIVYVIFGIFYGVSIWDVIGISFFLSVITFTLVDLFILPKLGDLSAMFSDFGLSFLSLVIFGGVFIEEFIILGSLSLFVTTLLLVWESYFHKYVTKNVLKEETKGNIIVEPRINFITEFAEEMDVSDISKQKSDENDVR
ncbi:DUF2512 family protein [Evansella sp. AB-rgal1]|uniref:DUF2512 family protein n=1 Tax=Evansella sp. AB-rgal1 TaxID=3242696 RepID=UPI00359DBA46